MEQVIDSSRFFAVRVIDGPRKAILGVGFEDRSDAFDFGVALQEVRVIPVLDRPGPRPLLLVEEGACRGCVGGSIEACDGLGDVDKLGQGAEVEELVVGEVVGCGGVCAVAAAVGVGGEGVGGGASGPRCLSTMVES